MKAFLHNKKRWPSSFYTKKSYYNVSVKDLSILVSAGCFVFLLFVIPASKFQGIEILKCKETKTMYNYTQGGHSKQNRNKKRVKKWKGSDSKLMRSDKNLPNRFSLASPFVQMHGLTFLTVEKKNISLTCKHIITCQLRRLAGVKELLLVLLLFFRAQ